MPTVSSLPRNLLAISALSVAASMLGANALASDHPAPAPAPAAATPATASVVAAATPPATAAKASGADVKIASVEPKTAAKAVTPTPPTIAPPRDSIDKLREQLAAQLGATKAAKTGSRNDLRIATATPSAAHESSARPSRAGNAQASGKSTSHSSTDAAHAHWSYEGSGGPAGWGMMKPEFTKCSTGTRQSPIDIRDGIRVSLDAVQFDYKPSTFRVIDNGHTVQVNVGQGNSIEVMGRRYDLVQFHFHRPSEERINGKQFDMVAHLVHKDPEGKLAVVAVLLERGGAQPIVQTIWNNLPLEKGEEVPAKAMLDLSALLPAERSYYTYMGSLTTPPCSEGVLWMVMKNPVPISTEQIGIFTRLYPMNARPIQSASGRLIKESN